MRVISFLFLALLFTTCSPDRNKRLTFALSLADENKVELVKLLKHYESDPEKYAAACFLIENMIGRYSFKSTYQDSIKQILSEALRNGQKTGDELVINIKVAEKWNNVPYQYTKKYDLQHIKADLLIENIDQAFIVWKKYTWNRSLSFDDFCEYILPYRIGNEELSDWRKLFYEKYSPVLDAYTGNDVVEACNILIRELKKEELYYNTDFSIPHMGGAYLFENRLGSCREGCDIGVYAMRACGIPAATDQYIYSPTYQVGHSWNVVRDTTGKFLPFWFTQYEARRDMKDDGRRKGKVYRHCYKIQTKHPDSRMNDRSIPALFMDPLIKDVSTNYFGKNEVLIPVQTEDDYALLGVFSPQQWIAVDIAPTKRGKSRFNNIETNVVFQPLCLKNESLQPTGYPFVFNGEKIHFFIPDTTQWEKAVITRKFPIRQYGIDYMNLNMHGAKIEGAKMQSFTTATLLATTPDTITKNRYTVQIERPMNCRFIRFTAPTGKPIELADISVYSDTSGRIPIPMKIIKSPAPLLSVEEYNVENICDNNPLTYFVSRDSSCQIVFDLGKEIQIKQLTYIPRNDENFITPNDLYELYYLDNRKGWVSLGEKSSTDGELHYRVPKGALCRIENKTQGVEAQVFYIQNSKQVFSCDINSDSEIYKQNN